MSGPEWIELLNMIPEDQHSQLNVMCRSGVELSIDALLRTETSFLVYRGRLVGTTDEGRVFFTPYSEITSLYLNRFVMEKEVDAIFEPDNVGVPASLLNAPLDEDIPAVLANTRPPGGGAQAVPLVFPNIGKNGSGLVPRVSPATVAPPTTKPQHSSGLVPTLGADIANPTAPMPKVATFIPPPPPASTDGASKGSILDRLRAQRGGTGGRKQSN